MTNVIKVILSIICIAAIFLIQLQSGKADGLSAAITGKNKEMNLFSNRKARGSDLILQRSTIVCILAFFVLTIAIANL